MAGRLSATANAVCAQIGLTCDRDRRHNNATANHSERYMKLNVKCSNGKTLNLEIRRKTVLELKEAIARTATRRRRTAAHLQREGARGHAETLTCAVQEGHRSPWCAAPRRPRRRRHRRRTHAGCGADADAGQPPPAAAMNPMAAMMGGMGGGMGGMGGGMGGNPMAAMMGGGMGGGGGGAPNMAGLAQMMNNPGFQQMMQAMMTDPQAMQAMQTMMAVQQSGNPAAAQAAVMRLMQNPAMSGAMMQMMNGAPRASRRHRRNARSAQFGATLCANARAIRAINSAQSARCWSLLLDAATHLSLSRTGDDADDDGAGDGRRRRRDGRHGAAPAGWAAAPAGMTRCSRR